MVLEWFNASLEYIWYSMHHWSIYGIQCITGVYMVFNASLEYIWYSMHHWSIYGITDIQC